MKRVLAIIVIIILIPVLFVNGVILIDSIAHPDEVPSFFGWKPFIVLSGSMEAEINAGDLVVAKEVEPKELKENDVIAFKQGDVVITHRIIEIIDNGDGTVKYKTKGDNNNVEDKEYVYENQVEGIYMFKISRVGNAVMFIQTPIGTVCALLIPIIIFIFAQMAELKENKDDLKNKRKKEQDMQEEIEKLKKQNEELMKK